VIAVGNHVALPTAAHSAALQPVKHARVAPEVIALAHLPARGAQAHQQDHHRLAGALAWREGTMPTSVSLARALSRVGQWPSVERLRTIAANYGLPMGGVASRGRDRAHRRSAASSRIALRTR
jgi:hypothetical protein